MVGIYIVKFHSELGRCKKSVQSSCTNKVNKQFTSIARPVRFHCQGGGNPACLLCLLEGQILANPAQLLSSRIRLFQLHIQQSRKHRHCPEWPQTMEERSLRSIISPRKCLNTRLVPPISCTGSWIWEGKQFLDLLQWSNII